MRHWEVIAWVYACILAKVHFSKSPFFMPKAVNFAYEYKNPTLGKSYYKPNKSIIIRYRKKESRQNFIAPFAHSTFAVRSQNAIYSGYNWPSHQKQN